MLAAARTAVRAGAGMAGPAAGAAATAAGAAATAAGAHGRWFASQRTAGEMAEAAAQGLREAAETGRAVPQAVLRQYVEDFWLEPWSTAHVNDAHRRFWIGTPDRQIQELLERRRMHKMRKQWMREFEEEERQATAEREALRAKLRQEKRERDAQKELLKAERTKAHRVRMQLFSERKAARRERCVARAQAQGVHYQKVKEEFMQCLMEDQDKWMYHPDELRNKPYRLSKYDTDDYFTKFN